LEELLQRYNWNWATKFQTLQLVQLYPNQEWPFSYRYPNDCLNLVRIWNGFHTDDRSNMVRFIVTNDANGKVIYSDFGPTELLSGDPLNPTPAPTVSGTPSVYVIGQYIQNTQDVTIMPPMFKMAFSFFLAAYAAPSIPGIGQVDLREKNLQLGEQRLAMAIARDQNETRAPHDFRSILEKARMGSNGYRMTAGGWQAIPGLNWNV